MRCFSHMLLNPDSSVDIFEFLTQSLLHVTFLSGFVKHLTLDEVRSDFAFLTWR